MWSRSINASTNGFACESFLDELAVEAGKDPLAFRREYLKDKRLHKFIDKMEAVSGWKNRKRSEGYGVAITECFASTVGQVVKISKVSYGGVKIDQVWAVMNCGWYVNRDTVRAQVEGAIVMGLGAVTDHQVAFKDLMAADRNFSTFQMPSIKEISRMEIHIEEND